ncbi:hypothetical protein CPB86DRAFT_818021 [Serendipita vermifera]|nr:hypothetical protein CPB86DRAFT_818021 [Serendipita vermifera]
MNYGLAPEQITPEYVAAVWTQSYKAAGLTPPDFDAVENGDLPCVVLSTINAASRMFLPGTWMNEKLDLAALSARARSTGAKKKRTILGKYGNKSTRYSFSGDWQLTIYHPIITSRNYYWFGHGASPETWVFKQRPMDLHFFPFSEMGSFDVLWKSEPDEDGQRFYILKPYPLYEDYEALGYCFHRGTDPCPDMTSGPWNLLRAVKTSLLEALSYKAKLVWLDTSSTRPCSIWKVIPSEGVVPPNLYYITSENVLPECMFLFKQSGIDPSESVYRLSSKDFKTYRTYDRATAFDSVKDMDRKLTSHLGKLLRLGNATIQWLAAGQLAELAKYPEWREDIRPCIPQLHALRSSKNSYVRDAAKKALLKLAKYPGFSEEIAQLEKHHLGSANTHEDIEYQGMNDTNHIGVGWKSTLFSLVRYLPIVHRAFT